LGGCDYRRKLNEFRNIERRRSFREHLTDSFCPIERQTKENSGVLKIRFEVFGIKPMLFAKLRLI